MVYLKKRHSHTLGRWWSTKKLKNEGDYYAGSAVTSASPDPTCLPLPGNSLTSAGAATLVASPDSSLKILGALGLIQVASSAALIASPNPSELPMPKMILSVARDTKTFPPSSLLVAYVIIFVCKVDVLKVVVSLAIFFVSCFCF